MDNERDVESDALSEMLPLREVERDTEVLTEIEGDELIETVGVSDALSLTENVDVTDADQEALLDGVTLTLKDHDVLVETEFDTECEVDTEVEGVAEPLDVADPVAVGDALLDGLAESEGEALPLPLGVVERLELTDCDVVSERESDAVVVVLPESDAVVLADKEGVNEDDADADAVVETEFEAVQDGVADSDIEPLVEGEAEVDGVCESEADPLVEADGDADVLGEWLTEDDSVEECDAL